MNRIIIFLLLISLFLCACDAGEGYTECWGECRLTENGGHILVQDDRTIYMTDGSEDGNLFDTLSFGDNIKIHVVLIKDTDGKLTTNVLRCEKVTDFSKIGGK